MKTQIYIFLLLLIAICFLSVFSCMAAVDSAVAVAQTADNHSHTYRYSRKHITDIQISIPNAEVTLYTQPLQEEIVVQVTGGTIEGAEEDKILLLRSDEQQLYRLEIYLPERFYNIEIDSKSIKLETCDTMRGNMAIKADFLKAELNDYYGGVSFAAKEGSVSIEDGNLQKASAVTLTEKGNIYLHTKITDYSGMSSFYTKQGAVKVGTDLLASDTFFEVSALTVSGEYQALSVQDRLDKNCHKVQIISENGIAFFYN